MMLTFMLCIIHTQMLRFNRLMRLNVCGRRKKESKKCTAKKMKTILPAAATTFKFSKSDDDDDVTLSVRLSVCSALINYLCICKLKHQVARKSNHFPI